jgi:nucleotide-binding universal stress UspA family protein
VQRQEIRRAAVRQLDEFVHRHVRGDLVAGQRLATGTAWRMIRAAAHALDADLIVMGSVGRAGISGLLIGNTAEKVLRVCDRSILTVKPDGFVSPVQPVP